MMRRSTRKTSIVKREASLSPSLSEVPATSSSTIKQEFTELEVDVKAEPSPTKSRKRKRRDENDSKEPPPPKREARYRKSCPKTVVDRMERVLSQRMFMVHRSGVDSSSGSIRETFNMLGSTGNIYTIEMGTKPSCDCPDNLKGNSPCKHILFIFLKVLKVPQTSDLWFQKALLPDELASIYASAPTSTDAIASEAVQRAFRKATSGADHDEEPTAQPDDRKVVAEGELVDETGPGGRRLTTIGDDCPICFEEMTREDFESGRLVFDISVGGCGKRKMPLRYLQLTTISSSRRVLQDVVFICKEQGHFIYLRLVPCSLGCAGAADQGRSRTHQVRIYEHGQHCGYEWYPRHFHLSPPFRQRRQRQDLGRRLRGG